MNSSFKRTYMVITLLICTFAFGTAASAQCKAPAKEAIKKLSPYNYNGSVNNTTVVLGEPSVIKLSFYKGLNYKLQLAAEAAVGEIRFRITDEDGKEICDNQNDKAMSYEFYSNASQELTIEVRTVDKAKQGCVAVVVGMQMPKSNALRNL